MSNAVFGQQFRAVYIATQANFGPFGGLGSFAVLGTVNVGTGVASAVLKIYDGQDATGTLIATIDASAKGTYNYFCACKNGIFAVQSGGNGLITLTHT